MLMNVGTCNATLLSRRESAHPLLLLLALKCEQCSVIERGGYCIWKMCSAEQGVHRQYCCKVCVMGQMSTNIVVRRQCCVNDSTWSI